MAKQKIDDLSTDDIDVDETPSTSIPATADEVKTVEVPVEQLSSILGKIESLETRLGEKDAEIQALQGTVSKTRLDEETSKIGQDTRPRAHFKVLEGKVVIGWPEQVGEEKVNEHVISPQTGLVVGEVLKSKYYFLDGTKSPLIDQVRFAKIQELAYARLVDQKGDIGVFEFEDKSRFGSETFESHVKFWNA